MRCQILLMPDRAICRRPADYMVDGCSMCERCLKMNKTIEFREQLDGKAVL